MAYKQYYEGFHILVGAHNYMDQKYHPNYRFQLSMDSEILKLLNRTLLVLQ
jgi:hypothetical protein